MNGDEKWLVVACNADFIITDIITIKNIEINLQVNDPVDKIVLLDDMHKFLDFTLNLKHQKVVFGYEMSIINDNQSTMIMNFGATVYGDNFIITAFSNYISLYEELMKINNEQINLLREKIKNTFTVPNDYQKFTELNNEIINMQRELYKKNAYVSDLLQKKQEMLQIIDTQKIFFKQMINAIPDPIFYKDTCSNYLGCNKAFAEKIIGLPEEEIINKTDADFLQDGQSTQFLRQNDQEIFVTRETKIYEETIMMADDTMIEVETLKTPFYNEDGNIGGIIGISRDISLRKDMEDKLRTAKEQAESSTIMKSQFLANMSHEIRTPMNGIMGFLELLNMSNPSIEQQEFIREAKTAAELLLYIINDILDFSKIEAGKLTMENTNFKIRTTIEDAVSILVPRAIEKKIQLHTMIKASVPEEVSGDPVRLRQILNNLLSNAVKFTKEGEVSITVDCTEEENEIALLTFAIKDTGIGIDQQDIHKLFHSFSQANSTTTREYGGTGLGLAISKELVEMMDGAFHVESILGEGSTFSFDVRLKISQRVSEQKVIFEKLSGEKVLIVDDNTNNRRIIGAYLKDAGCNVFEAKDAGNAITTIISNASTDNKIKVAIIDYQMPSMSGYELATTLQTIPFAKDIKLILLTSVTQKGDAVKAKNMGFAAYLIKPIRRDELLNCIAVVLGVNGQEEQIPIVTKYLAKEVKNAFQPKILLVEDNVMNRKIVITMLRAHDMSCDVAVNGSEALKAVAEKGYDLVFMDCQMPVMDGYQSTNAIRKLEGDGKHTRIIAMTANAMEGDRVKCIEAGMDDYISKPIDFEAMLKIIEDNTKQGVGHLGLTDNHIDNFMNATGLSKEDAQELFTEYMRYLPNILTDIKDAIAHNNLARIGELAHQLKGSSGSLKITSIYEVAMKLEKAAMEQDKDGCESFFEEIEVLFHLFPTNSD